jgi:hypothetical protein
MSDSQDEWQADAETYRPDEGSDEPGPVRRRRVNYIGWLMSLAGVAWLFFFVVFVARSIGWSLVPELLPHEIGGLVAGLLVPAAILLPWRL